MQFKPVAGECVNIVPNGNLSVTARWHEPVMKALKASDVCLVDALVCQA